MLAYRDLEIAQEVAYRLVCTFKNKVDRVVLFGSRARGDSRKDSDYDLLVLGDLGKCSPLENQEVAMICVSDFALGVDLLVYTQEEYETKCLIRSQIDKEGIIVYDRVCE